MYDFEVVRFQAAELLAQSAAEQWLEEIESASLKGAAFRVAVSGGRIAGRLFSAVATLAAERKNILAPVHFFWGDERCVLPTDPESNFHLAHELLLAPLAIPDAQIHRIRGEAQPDAAAAYAAQELVRFAPLNANGQPVLDLVFLGMGEDGHVASLFPEEPLAMSNDRGVYRPVVAVKPPPHRITLGYGTIAAARRVWVLASGPAKEAALRASLAADGQTPLARVLHLRQQSNVALGTGQTRSPANSLTRIFTDIAA